MSTEVQAWQLYKMQMLVFRKLEQRIFNMHMQRHVLCWFHLLQNLFMHDAIVAF